MSLLIKPWFAISLFCFVAQGSEEQPFHGAAAYTLWCKWPWPQVSLRSSLSRNQADGSEAVCCPHLGGTDRGRLSVLQSPPLWPFEVQRRGGAPQERQREGGDRGLPKGHSHSLTLSSLQLSGPQSLSEYTAWEIEGRGTGRNDF